VKTAEYHPVVGSGVVHFSERAAMRFPMKKIAKKEKLLDAAARRGWRAH
jgi:hypothetical protein